MSDELVRIANALERIADAYDKKLHIEVDHAHIDDIGEIHGEVGPHPKAFKGGEIGFLDLAIREKKSRQKMTKKVELD